MLQVQKICSFVTISASYKQETQQTYQPDLSWAFATDYKFGTPPTKSLCDTTQLEPRPGPYGGGQRSIGAPRRHLQISELPLVYSTKDAAATETILRSLFVSTDSTTTNTTDILLQNSSAGRVPERQLPLW